MINVLVIAFVITISACKFPELPPIWDDAPPDALAADDAPIDAVVIPPGMVDVPAGAFRMGCNLPAGCGPVPDALPFHEVTLSRYAIDRAEVSRADYAACAAASVCTEPPSGGLDAGSSLPVQASHAAAVTFCAWRSKRLPTEAEWEKAARSYDARSYPWGDLAPTCSLARYSACTPNMLDPVDSHPLGASPYGAVNMSGNQWEWTADWYSATYYQTGAGTNPPGPTAGSERVVRGGDYLDGGSGSQHLMTWYRRKFAPTENYVGFRCAVSL